MRRFVLPACWPTAVLVAIPLAFTPGGAGASGDGEPAAAAVPAGAAPRPSERPAAAQVAEREAERSTHLDALLTGVSEIATPGSPGTIVAFGAFAFPVVLAESGASAVPTVAAAALHAAGNSNGGLSVGPSGGPSGGPSVGPSVGRVVAFSHGGYFGAEAVTVAETGEFLRRSLLWSAGRDSSATDGDGERRPPALRVGLRHAKEFAPFVEACGFTPVVLGGKEWTKQLGDINVLVCLDADIAAAEIEAVTTFVRRGGGLLAAMTPWGWAQIKSRSGREADVRDAPLNRLINRFGLAWTDQAVGRTGTHGFVTAPRPSTLHHGREAFDLLRRHSDGEVAMTDAALAPASTNATLALRFLPAEEGELRGEVDRLVATRGAALAPTRERPLGRAQALDRVLLAHQINVLRGLPASQIQAHPGAATFPGEVPGDATLTARDIAIDLATPGWHSTGLYAVAGKPLGVVLAAEALTHGLAVRIGCHTDGLWHHESWERVPEIAMRVLLAEERTTVASPFGGPVYIDVPGGVKGSTSVRIEGAVEAPRFVLGSTTPAQWKIQREAPAPWAELETAKVILSVPSESIRGLEDPTPLLAYWDRILDAAADLATIPRDRTRPERYVPDQQISAGYMHSGYPIMTHLDAVADMTQVDRLAQGSWGLFHELGHNHQDGMWTFDGTVEVTCNLFSMYICQEVCGLEPREGHDALADRERRIATFFAPERRSSARAKQDAADGGPRESGASFERWKRDPFTALVMYQQLREAFGWELYQQVFAEYRELPREARPRSEEEKRSQWMVRLSRATGHNLGPFFDLWHVPVSNEAKASIADLPIWMPEEMSRWSATESSDS